MPAPVVIRLPAAARVFQAVALVAVIGVTVKAAADFDLPLFLLATAAFAAFGLRSASIVVRADSNGLFVRNMLRTHEIPWSQVERFGFGSLPQGLGFDRVVHVVLRDGELVPLDATRRAGGKLRMQEQVRRLQAWLDY